MIIAVSGGVNGVTYTLPRVKIRILLQIDVQRIANGGLLCQCLVFIEIDTDQQTVVGCYVVNDGADGVFLVAERAAIELLH
ncbi:MAG: hypothetical protein IIX61_06510 [Loktanella sp.]|nr:hypothetical protein [Loktanella sp.]